MNILALYSVFWNELGWSPAEVNRLTLEEIKLVLSLIRKRKE